MPYPKKRKFFVSDDESNYNYKTKQQQQKTYCSYIFVVIRLDHQNVMEMNLKFGSPYKTKQQPR